MKGRFRGFRRVAVVGVVASSLLIGVFAGQANAQVDLQKIPVCDLFHCPGMTYCDMDYYGTYAGSTNRRAFSDASASCDDPTTIHGSIEIKADKPITGNPSDSGSCQECTGVSLRTAVVQALAGPVCFQATWSYAWPNSNGGAPGGWDEGFTNTACSS
jgi:hypothetical protein